MRSRFDCRSLDGLCDRSIIFQDVDRSVTQCDHAQLSIARWFCDRV
ncbi:hypothetical protein [Phormidesmis sp. 146-33]